ncbi:MAG TPA: Ig-like domain-containing protein [Cyclobacteriaceae bacterium]|nr:Ig-like domain-containing protein [Cyclobacteriaceae bacterium]
MRQLLLFGILLLLYLAVSCAQQTSPTGGPKDTIPPVLIESAPPNKTINFRGKSITLTFDEDVVANNPREQLLVTPSIGNKFEMEVRKKNVILNFNSDLKDSTTYTINFRESIQDITEKNPAENLQIALSTGSYLDSLKITGKIYDLLSGKEIKDGTAALYIDSDTFDVFKHKPSYLTKSNEKGDFNFNNLKPDKYNIYAFTDKNKNLVVDSKTERYGFIAAPIELKPDSNYHYSIPIIPLDARELKLISAKPFNTYFNIRFSKNLKDYKVSPLRPEDSTKFMHIYGDDHTAIHLFFNSQSLDSIPINLTAQDTIGNSLDTLLYAKLNAKKSEPEKFTISIPASFFVSEKDRLEATIKVNKPVAKMNVDSADYQIDSTHTILFSSADFTWEPNASQLKLHKQIQKDQMPQPIEIENDRKSFNSPSQTTPKNINKLRIKKSFFITVDNDTSQQIDQTVNVLTPENTGVILVQINTIEKNFIVQLLTQDGKIFQSFNNTANISFKTLPPSNYLIRLVIDLNNNQQWDAGNFYKKEQPEPIVFYQSESGERTVNIKANWELGPLLISYP